MQKLTYVLLGVAIAAAAFALASWRHYFEPMQRGKSGSYTSQSSQNPARAPAPSATTAQPSNKTATAPANTQRQSANTATTGTTTAATTASGMLSFDQIVNILNVVVGILGIWMTLHGIRMQRQAMAVAPRRDG